MSAPITSAVAAGAASAGLINDVIKTVQGSLESLIQQRQALDLELSRISDTLQVLQNALIVHLPALPIAAAFSAGHSVPSPAVANLPSSPVQPPSPPVSSPSDNGSSLPTSDHASLPTPVLEIARSPVSPTSPTDPTVLSPHSPPDSRPHSPCNEAPGSPSPSRALMLPPFPPSVFDSANAVRFETPASSSTVRSTRSRRAGTPYPERSPQAPRPRRLVHEDSFVHRPDAVQSVPRALRKEGAFYHVSNRHTYPYKAPNGIVPTTRPALVSAPSDPTPSTPPSPKRKRSTEIEEESAAAPVPGASCSEEGAPKKRKTRDDDYEDKPRTPTRKLPARKSAGRV